MGKRAPFPLLNEGLLLDGWLDELLLSLSLHNAGNSTAGQLLRRTFLFPNDGALDHLFIDGLDTVPSHRFKDSSLDHRLDFLDNTTMDNILDERFTSNDLFHNGATVNDIAMIMLTLLLLVSSVHLVPVVMAPEEGLTAMRMKGWIAEEALLLLQRLRLLLEALLSKSKLRLGILDGLLLKLLLLRVIGIHGDLQWQERKNEVR